VEDSQSWDSTIARIVENPGVTVVIGDVDTGKTTFVLDLVNAGVKAGIPTAVVDSDTGQSEIGPPTVVGMATVDQPIKSLRDVRARRMYFVGSTTPAGNLLPVVVGAKKMVDAALARGAKLVVVDTTGLVKGIMGRRLKFYKIDLLSPEHVVGIRSKRELDPILSVLSRIDRLKVHRVDVSSEAKGKTREFRAARRRSQFYEYFKDADRHIIRLDDIVCWNTFFTAGRSVKWQHYRVLERTLKTKVLHAEVVGSGMYIVAECAPQMAGIDELRNRYGTREFTVVCGQDYSNLLVGLSDANANTVDLGIIEAIDFKQRHMAVVTPMSTVSPIRIVQFGFMRVRPDGTELGGVKPGEI
jgi:polynucleotide 5'-hydroxyl-kinase GRC3/NOL9